MDLSIIIARCQEGDPLAWEALVRQYQSRIYGLALHYVGNSEDARDVAQEVFIRIYRKLNMVVSGEYFLPWAIRITRNASIDHLRRKKARPNAGTVTIERLSQIRAKGNNPEQELAANSKRQLIHQALKELTSLNREIILLKEIAGLKLEEIASLLKVPLGTVKSRCNRARIELAERVAARGCE